MANDDLVPPELPKQQILPSDPFGQQTPMETSSVETQSDIPVKETADLGQQTQLLDKPKKLPVQEIPPRGVSDQENSSQVKQTADKAKDQRLPLGDQVYDAVFEKNSMIGLLKQNSELEQQRIGLLKQNSELKTSMRSLAFLYDVARRNCKKADVDKEKGLQRIDFTSNIKILQDPKWFDKELSSLLEENKILRENKIASAPHTPNRYDTSTLGEVQTISEELPYAAELYENIKAFRDKVETRVGILTGNIRVFDANIKKLNMMLNAETMAEEIKPAAELEEITNSIRSKATFGRKTVKLPLAATQKKKTIWSKATFGRKL